MDACNSVMDKMGYEQGLVRYTTLNQLDGKGWSWKRPKLIGYGIAVIVIMTITIPANNLIYQNLLKPGSLTWLGSQYAEVDLTFLGLISSQTEGGKLCSNIFGMLPSQRRIASGGIALPGR